MSSDGLTEVCRLLGLGAPTGTEACDLDSLLQMVETGPGTWAVYVDKVRDQYDVAGCTVESSEVVFDGKFFRTVAAEDPDPVKVRDTVARLGLLGRENISYVEAVHRIKAGILA